MNKKVIELSNLSYEEILRLKNQLELEKKGFEEDIVSSEEAIKDCEKRGDYSSRNDLRHDILYDNDQIGKIDFRLKQINEFLANIYTKAEMLARDIEVELTEQEANFIIDLFSPLKENKEQHIKDAKEAIEEYGGANNYEFDDELEELYADLKYEQDQFEKYEKIVNKATNSLTKRLK